jgi:hypothetical protein
MVRIDAKISLESGNRVLRTVNRPSFLRKRALRRGESLELEMVLIVLRDSMVRVLVGDSRLPNSLTSVGFGQLGHPHFGGFGISLFVYEDLG